MCFAYVAAEGEVERYRETMMATEDSERSVVYGLFDPKTVSRNNINLEVYRMSFIFYPNFLVLTMELFNNMQKSSGQISKLSSMPSPPAPPKKGIR